MPEPSAAPRSFRLGVQAKLLAVVLLCVVVPVRHPRPLPPAAEPGGPAREGRGGNLDSHLLRKQATFDDWMRDRAQEATRWSASFVVYEGLDAFAHSSPESRAARDLKSYLVSLLGHYRVYESLFVLDGRRTRAHRHPRRAARGVGAPAHAGRRSLRRRAREPAAQVVRAGPPDAAAPAADPAAGLLRAPGPRHRLLRRALRPARAGVDAGGRRHRPCPRALGARRRRGGSWPATGKVVDDPGANAFPVPAAATAASSAGASGGALVAEQHLAGLGSTVVRPAQPLRTRPRPAWWRPCPARRLPHPARVAARLILTGAAATFMIAILNFVAARELLRPILLLSEGAKRVAAGRSRVYLPVRGTTRSETSPAPSTTWRPAIREGRESLEAARDELARANAGLRPRTARWRPWPSPTG